MLFKDIKQNYPVYILDKQEFCIIQGKATAVSFPRVEMNQKTGRSEMVVDVTVEANGKTATYAIPENLSVTYAGNIVLSTDKQGLTGEVEAMESFGLMPFGKTKTEATLGDVTYLANMYYADLYPDPFKDEASCLRAAYRIAVDPDGYKGMIFCRWTADAIGKALSIDWEKFV